MWKTENEYLDMASEAAEKKQPFSAVVYALMALVSVFRDIRDTMYDVRNVVSAPNQSIVQPTIDTTQLENYDNPFCPYCANSMDPSIGCVNAACPGIQIGSIGDQVV